MSDNIIHQYLEDAKIELSTAEFDSFRKYCRLYFKELVGFGAFLRDVSFSDLTPMAKYSVIKSAYNLWKNGFIVTDL